MDFQSFKRRDLQSLCKLNKLPANTTNAAMAESLASLPTVEGLEELLGNLDSELQGSPERSAIAKPNGARTFTRQRAVKEDLQCSNLDTRTRCRTRNKAVEGTDTRKTPATRTTRKMASRQASIQKMDKELQADFEADMEQSQASESIVLPGGELQEVSEEVSGISLENGQLSESQSEAQYEVNDGQEVIDVDDCETNKEEDHVVNDVEAESNEVLNDSKVDFHSLIRKDLQNLCKKNKIPANMSNAAMADALDSLEFVEGLQEFVNKCDSKVPSSPLMSGITSPCARRSRTTQKITKEEPQSSKLIAKSCRGSRRRITEETEQIKNDVSRTPVAPTTMEKAAEAGSALYQFQQNEDSEVHRSGIKAMEDLSMETSDVSGAAEFNTDINNSLMQESQLNESALDEDNGKGNNVGSSKESEELVSQVVENVVKEEVLESAEVSEVFTDLVKVDISPEVEDLKSGFGVCESENTDDGQEPEEVVNADDQLSKEVVSEFSTEVDPSLSLEMNDESELGNCSLEKVVVTTETAPSLEDIVETESDGGYTEEDMTEKSDSEATSQDDHLSMEVNVESEPEESHTEDNEATSQDDNLSTEVDVESESKSPHTDEMSKNSDAQLGLEIIGEGIPEESEPEESHTKDGEAVTQDDNMSTEVNVSEANSQDVHLSTEVNVESETKSPQIDEISKKSDDQLGLEINVEGIPQATTDLAAENCNAKDLISNKFNFEVTTDLSLRQLKRLYKERLKAAKLANKMQNLTLKDTAEEIKVQEDLPENIVESVNVESSIVVPQITPEDEAIEGHVEESKECADAETEKLYDVDILLDNEVTSVDAVIGNINVVTCAPQFTQSKCSTAKTKKPMLTPSESANKMQMSAGRKSISDDNKENIDSNVKSEVGKTKIAFTENVDILSPLSMAKLKKNIKFLQQQSEKKKQALKSRSGNLLLIP